MVREHFISAILKVVFYFISVNMFAFRKLWSRWICKNWSKRQNFPFWRTRNAEGKNIYMGQRKLAKDFFFIFRGVSCLQMVNCLVAFVAEHLYERRKFIQLISLNLCHHFSNSLMKNLTDLTNL